MQTTIFYVKYENDDTLPFCELDLYLVAVNVLYLTFQATADTKNNISSKISTDPNTKCLLFIIMSMSTLKTNEIWHFKVKTHQYIHNTVRVEISTLPLSW